MIRPPFDPRGPFVARKPFAHGCGRTFQRGEPFPGKELGATERQLWIMFRAHLIDSVQPEGRKTLRQPKVIKARETAK